METILDKYTHTIDSYLTKIFSEKIADDRHILHDAMEYSINGKSKRIRPILCIAAHQLFSSNMDAILPLAAAVEMIHTYSLIHDDLPAMDNDDMRRGQASCHKQFSECLAILAGDTLNTWAFEIISDKLRPYYPANCILSSIIQLSHDCGIHGMAGGQSLDMHHPNRKNTATELDHIHHLKTGSLIRSCITLPAILEQAEDTIINLLKQIGNNLGLLFQITDDILDVEGNINRLGKSPNKDNAQDKLTYIRIWGLQQAKQKARILAKETHAQIKQLPVTPALLDHIIEVILNRTH